MTDTGSSPVRVFPAVVVTFLFNLGFFCFFQPQSLKSSVILKTILFWNEPSPDSLIHRVHE